MTAAAKSRLLTVPEIADRLRISKRSAYRVAREMMHAEIAGRLVVPEQAVERYIEQKLKEPTWANSTGATGPSMATTSIATASANGNRSARRTKALPVPGSETSSCRRPIEVRTKPKS